MTFEFGSGGTALEKVHALDVPESASDAVAVLDPEWRFVHVNDRLQAMARMPREKLLGRSLWDAFPQLTSTGSYPDFQRSMRERMHTHFEEFYAPYDLWLDVNCFPAADGLVIFARDISERKRGDQQLRDSEERYRRLFETTGDGILIVNNEGRYIDVNDSFCRILKSTRERLIGAHFSEFIPPGRLGEAEQAFRALRSGRAEPMDFPLRACDGSVVELAWITSSYYLPGLHFCSCRDISERKRSEMDHLLLLEREQEARETAELLNTVGPRLLAELDPEKLTQAVVEIATRLTGAETGAFLPNANSGKAAYTVRSSAGVRSASPGPLPRDNAWRAVTFRGEAVIRLDDIGEDGGSGSPAWRSYLAAPVISRSGEVLGGLFFGHSAVGRFTEHHESIAAGIAAQAAIAMDNARLFEEAQWIQNELKRSNEGLRRANKDLETFAYSASHDLQEPLRNVALSAQLLQRILERGQEQGVNEAFGSDAAKYMQGILNGAQRMENLVRDLLSYTRATQHSEGPIKSVDAGATLVSVLQNLRSRIDQTGAEISTGELPVISMRQIHLAQIFQNLISNALEYRGKESPRVHITATRQDGWWVFSVADNGIGIEARYANQIFGLFKRLHTRDQHPGSGIGLAICQRIVEQYGGRIWLERSVPGEGSVFNFSFPDR